MKKNQYLMDFSLGLINRTGAYFVCRDILEQLPEYFPSVRYWRMMLQRTPDGTSRRIVARLMMLELRLLRGREIAHWPEGRFVQGRTRLILDPLYVLRSKLEREDIVQCHDIGPVSHPELFGPLISGLYEEAYQKIKRTGCGMVFVSDASQSAFRERYGDKFRFMQTVAQYVRPGILSGETSPCPGVKAPFLLTVGALELRKNHLRVLEAYQRSGLHKRGVGYVFCGARGIGSDEILKKASTIPGVTALGYVTEPQLRWLYMNGCGFVLPSMLEGFGLPPIEAAQRGLVPLVTAGGAQEEAIGGAGVLVDPYCLESITDGLVRLVDMSADERSAHLQKTVRRGKVLTFNRYISAWDKILQKNDKFMHTDGWAASDSEELVA
ncbi:MAG: glycosyltransferase [Hyphomicrobiales bacterium]|nr:glycosyltransferase [Hyphomicrobiales bacterium]